MRKILEQEQPYPSLSGTHSHASRHDKLYYFSNIFSDVNELVKMHQLSGFNIHE